MPAGIYNITIEKGATFQRVLTWKDATGALVDLSTYTARAMGRANDYTGALLFSLTSASGLTLGGVAGTITMVISATATSGMTPGTNGVWDLEMISGAGVVTRLVQGKIEVSPEVTY